MTDADRPAPRSPTVFEGTFIDTATSTTDTLRVIVPAFDDGEHAYECAWAPRVDDAGVTVLPVTGDWALVTESAEGTVCVILWQPS